MHGTKKNYAHKYFTTIEFLKKKKKKENISFIEKTIELVIFNIFRIVLGRPIVGEVRLYEHALITSTD